MFSKVTLVPVCNKIGRTIRNHFFWIYKTTEDKNIKILQDKNQLEQSRAQGAKVLGWRILCNWKYIKGEDTDCFCVQWNHGSLKAGEVIQDKWNYICALSIQPFILASVEEWMQWKSWEDLYCGPVGDGGTCMARVESLNLSLRDSKSPPANL